MEAGLAAVRGCCRRCFGLAAEWAEGKDAAYSQIREEDEDDERAVRRRMEERRAAQQAAGQQPRQQPAQASTAPLQAAAAETRARRPPAAAEVDRRTPSRPSPDDVQKLLQALRGRWVHQDQRSPASGGHWQVAGGQAAGEVVEVIQGDVVRGPDGSQAQIVVDTSDSIAMEHGGEIHRAHLVGDKLFWTDGDVWVRAAQGTEWTARWTHAQVDPLQAGRGLEQRPSDPLRPEEQREPGRQPSRPSSPASAASAPRPPSTPTSPTAAAEAPRLPAAAPLPALRATTHAAAAPSAPATAARAAPASAAEAPRPRGDAAALAAFAGRWRHQDSPHIVEVILGDIIRGPDGTETKVKLQGSTAFSIELNGASHYAELVDGQLLWDDGDVWFPDRVPYAFNGRWTHKSNPGVVEVVRGDIIHGPDGTLTQLKQKSEDSFAIKLGGQTYNAQLVGDQLVWDDGDIWIRGGPFDGRWVHRGNPTMKEVIKGDVIHRPNGCSVQLVAEGAERFHIKVDGATRTARLINGDLVWDDGGIWILMPEQTHSEMEENEFDHSCWISEVRKVSMEHEDSLMKLIDPQPTPEVQEDRRAGGEQAPAEEAAGRAGSVAAEHGEADGAAVPQDQQQPDANASVRPTGAEQTCRRPQEDAVEDARPGPAVASGTEAEAPEGAAAAGASENARSLIASRTTSARRATSARREADRSSAGRSSATRRAASVHAATRQR